MDGWMEYGGLRGCDDGDQNTNQNGTRGKICIMISMAS